LHYLYYFNALKCVVVGATVVGCINTDLQEFYELTLLDDNKTTQQKTLETLQIASRWELDPPIVGSQQQSEVCR